jgi:hypothetical protein
VGLFFNANPFSSTKDKAQTANLLFGSEERAPTHASQPNWAPSDEGGVSPPMSNQKDSSARDQNAFRRIDRKASGQNGHELKKVTESRTTHFSIF